MEIERSAVHHQQRQRRGRTPCAWMAEGAGSAMGTELCKSAESPCAAKNVVEVASPTKWKSSEAQFTTSSGNGVGERRALGWRRAPARRWGPNCANRLKAPARRKTSSKWPRRPNGNRAKRSSPPAAATAWENAVRLDGGGRRLGDGDRTVQIG